MRLTSRDCKRPTPTGVSVTHTHTLQPYEPLSQPTPTAPPSMTPHPSGGSSSTSTCSYLHPQHDINARNPPYMTQSVTASTPLSLVILPTYLTQPCKSNDSRKTHALPTTYNGKNQSAQFAANDDQYRTAVGLACSSQSIATIGPHNISHVNKLYTQPVPPCNHPRPTPSTPHQSFSLPGDICNTILHAAKNKGAGINADSIDLFKALIKQPIPSIKLDLHYIFDLTKTSSHNPSSVTSLMSIYFVYTRIPRTPPNFAPLESPPPFVASLQATLPTPFKTNLHPTFFPTTMRLASLMAATCGKGNATLHRKIHPNTPTNQHPTLPRSRLL